MAAPALMTVDTDQATLLVDICTQFVGFNSVRTGRRLVGSKRGAIFAGKIVLIPAIVIAAHIVAVMAAQTLYVRGGNKGMGLQFSALKGEMASATAGTVGDGGIGITRGIDMAAQAATTEHVVGQRQRGCQRGCHRDVLRYVQTVFRSEMGPNRVDFFVEGEM